MESSTRFETVYAWFLGVFTFVMLLVPKPIGICFILFLGVVVTGMIRRKMKFRADLPGLLLIALYLLYLFYIVFTRNPEWAGKYAVYKLSFVLLPLLFFFRPTGKIRWNIPLSVFVLSTVALFVEGIFHSAGCYSQSHSPLCFLTVQFSHIHHPTYTSLFFTLSMGILIYGFAKKWKGYNLVTLTGGLLLMIAGITLCLSLAGVLFMMLFFAAVILLLIYRKFGKAVAALALILVPLAGYFAIQLVPEFKGEYEGAKTSAQQYMDDPEGFVRTHVYPDAGGSEVRLIMWTVSAKAFGEYPMGVGTGNVDGVLAQRLHALGQHVLASKIEDYNPHNQYLQTGIEIGVFGLLILLGILVSGFFVAVKHRNWLLLLVISGFAFNMLFESMLQRQSGIVFFAFAVGLLIAMDKNSMRPEPEMHTVS